MGDNVVTLLSATAVGSEARRRGHRFAVERLRESLHEAEAAQLFRVLTANALAAEEWAELAALACTWLDRFGQERSAPTVFLPVLGAPGLRASPWNRLVEHALAWLARRPPATSHMVVYDLLAVRAVSLEPRVRDQALRLWLDLHGRPGTAWFVRASRRAAVALADGTPHALDVNFAISCAMPDLHHDQPDELPSSAGGLATWIRMRVRSTNPASPAELRRAFDRLRQLAGECAVFHAAAVLPSLLPILAQAGDEVLLGDAEALALAIAAHPQLTPSMRRFFIGECRSRLAQWPDPQRGRALVEALQSHLPEHG